MIGIDLYTLNLRDFEILPVGVDTTKLSEDNEYRKRIYILVTMKDMDMIQMSSKDIFAIIKVMQTVLQKIKYLYSSRWKIINL